MTHAELTTAAFVSGAALAGLLIACLLLMEIRDELRTLNKRFRGGGP